VNNYIDLIEKSLGWKVKSIFQYTYFLDIFSQALIPALATWKLLLFNLYNFNIIDTTWFEDENNLTVNEESANQVFWRRFYFLVLFLVLVPFFLQRGVRLVHRVALTYLVMFVIVIVFLLLELWHYFIGFPLKDSSYETGKLFKKIEWDFPKKGMVFFIGYYV
jgi:hypothetical protein